MDALLAISNAIVRALERIALAAGWLLIVLMTVTCVDVICRKLSIPIPYTKFQEMEWHLHAAIFALWMGYCYVINAHPRVDSYTEALPFRRRAWIELDRMPAVRVAVHGRHPLFRLGLSEDLILAR